MRFDLTTAKLKTMPLHFHFDVIWQCFHRCYRCWPIHSNYKAIYFPEKKKETNLRVYWRNAKMAKLHSHRRLCCCWCCASKRLHGLIASYNTCVVFVARLGYFHILHGRLRSIFESWSIERVLLCTVAAQLFHVQQFHFLFSHFERCLFFCFLFFVVSHLDFGCSAIEYHFWFQFDLVEPHTTRVRYMDLPCTIHDACTKQLQNDM